MASDMSNTSHTIASSFPLWFPGCRYSTSDNAFQEKMTVLKRPTFNACQHSRCKIVRTRLLRPVVHIWKVFYSTVCIYHGSVLSVAVKCSDHRSCRQSEENVKLKLTLDDVNFAGILEAQ